MAERSAAATMARFVPIEAKLRRPVLSDDLVSRGRIVDRLIDSTHVPVVLVTAPPGFGKTVVVAQWDAADPRPFAWVSLDRGDDDPRVFASYVARALQRIGVIDARSMSFAADDPVASVAHQLNWLVELGRRPFVLVLDGTDAVQSPVIYEMITRLIDHVPRGSRVALIGRAVPPLRWDELRRQNRLFEIGTEDLRLSREEGRLLLELAGARLPSDAADSLLNETEGWAAGLYLAALRAEIEDVAADGAAVGSDSVVADYLREEVLSQLPSADQIFLRRSSILTALSAPLCDAVLERHNSAEALRRLARENIVTPQDTRPGWYRVRNLFREAMRMELGRQEPRLVKTLHARASSWLERNGDPDEAVEHAIAAGDVERSGELIWRRAPMSFAVGRIRTVEAWLDAFTRQQVVSEAKLALTAAWSALVHGLPADHWVAAAERGHYDAALPGESQSVAAAVSLLHSLVARNGVVQMGADARLAMSLLGDDDEWICTAELLDSVSVYLAHGTDEGQSRIEGVERHAAVQGDHPVHVVALAELAMMRLAEDDWPAAVDRMQRALRLVRDFSLDDMALLTLVQCIGALLDTHAGRRQEAEAQLRSCSRALARFVELPSWLGVQCRQMLARTYLMTDDAAATRAVLSEAQTLLRAIPDARVLHDEIYSLWRQVERLPMEIDSGASALSTAELRVLQLLPTYLSFEEIGRQLFVSRNTVKTQAIAAYRKLGVRSRAEAVERAYSLGLISG